MRIPSTDRIAFLLSLLVFAFLYGYGARGVGWFPDESLRSAWTGWNRAKKVLPFQSPFELSRVHEREGVRVQMPDEVQSGLTLIATNWEDFDWRFGLKLIDRDGNTVHQWRIDWSRISSDSGLPAILDQHLDYGQIHGVHLFPNGDVLINGGTERGTMRLDACGSLLWRVPRRTHHSVAKADDGSFWISSEKREDVEYPGFKQLAEPITVDYLLHVSADGEVMGEVNVLEVLVKNDLERLLVKAAENSSGWTYVSFDPQDLTHLNDVEPLPDTIAGDYPLFEEGDLLVSLRRPDLVLVLDPESKRVRWYTSVPFINQHDPDFLGDGWIGVFDNNNDGTDRGTLLGGSRIVALQPHTDSMEVLFPSSNSGRFHTRFGGKWQRLENGNMVLVETTAARIVEVAPDGSTVWEWVSKSYDGSTVPAVFGGERYDLTEQQVASWPCSPKEAELTQKGEEDTQ